MVAKNKEKLKTKKVEVKAIPTNLVPFVHELFSIGAGSHNPTNIPVKNPINRISYFNINSVNFNIFIDIFQNGIKFITS